MGYRLNFHTPGTLLCLPAYYSLNGDADYKINVAVCVISVGVYKNDVTDYRKSGGQHPFISARPEQSGAGNQQSVKQARQEKTIYRTFVKEKEKNEKI